MAKKIIPAALILAIFSVLVFAGAAFVGVAYADEEKADYSFSLSDFSVVADDETVAVYLDKPRDLQYEYLYYNGEEEIKFPTSDTVFDRKPVYEEGYSLTLRIFRAEDEEFNSFDLAVSVATNVGEGASAAVFPDGQTVVYNGSPYLYEGIDFYQGESPVQAMDAGKYEAKIDFGGEAGEVTTYFEIEKGSVMISPNNVIATYGNTPFPEAFTINGEITDEEFEYVREHVSLVMDGYSADMGAGMYTINIIYNGTEPANFDIVTRTGSYSVAKAKLTGFSMSNLHVMYDGNYHSLKVDYDDEIWQDVTIEYIVNEVREVGKYLCRATVKKENYEDLTLSAYITIMTDTLVSNNVDDVVTLIGGEFDPTWSISVKEDDREAVKTAAQSVLKSSDTKKDVIKGIYAIRVAENDTEIPIVGDYTIKIRPTAVTDSEGIRIYRYADGTMTELEYVFADGEFVFDVTGTYGIVFVGEEEVKQSALGKIILAILIGLIVVAMFVIIIDGFNKNGKEKKKWRKKHSKWA